MPDYPVYCGHERPFWQIRRPVYSRDVSRLAALLSLSRIQAANSFSALSAASCHAAFSVGIKRSSSRSVASSFGSLGGRPRFFPMLRLYGQKNRGQAILVLDERINARTINRMANGEIAMTNEREQRGLLIAATSKLTRKGNVWLVPSSSNGSNKYTVCPDKEHPHCTCPDHETRGCECKHIYAVRFVIQRELFPDGSVVETQQLTVTQKRVTYPQNWSAYNAAQTTEKHRFQVMLRDLCQTIAEPSRSPAGGRPSVPLRDAIFSACFKVYSTVSGRRFTVDLKEARDKGYIGRAPSYNTLFRVFEDPDTFDVLKSLVIRSALPLKAIETNFACDSSGFSGCRYDRWIEHKYGSPMKKTLRAWVKTHIMVGVKTNVVTAVEIHGQHTHDGTQLPALVETTAQQFKVNDVTADLAYSSHDNLINVVLAGGSPMIPFKHNATHGQGGLWSKMLAYFHINRDEFLKRYHQRSNVESTFSMIKRKFGDSVRSKLDVAMKNEVLAKLVCHNICCVNQEAHELGIDPGFGAETSVASLP
jgi:transposase